MANSILVLDDLEDVLAPAPNDLDVLTYDEASGKWKPMAAPPAGYTEGARVYHDADQNTVNLTWKVLAFNSERWDTDDIHSTVTNNHRLTCKTAGVYAIMGGIQFPGNATGYRSGLFSLNGVTTIAYQQCSIVGPVTTALMMSTIYQLAVGEWVEFWAKQTSGGNLVVQSIPQYSPEFMMQRIG